jgi:hypothetical protein
MTVVHFADVSTLYPREMILSPFGDYSGATRLAQREMGRGAWPEREGEMRREKKSRLAVGSWAQKAKGM